MRLSVIGLLLLFFAKTFAAGNQTPTVCGLEMEPVTLILCLDDDVKDIEELRTRIQNQVFNRIEIKYSKNDPKRAKFLKQKLNYSVQAWDKYRISYCDMETIHIRESDNRPEFIKECLLSVGKKRVEDLRLLQINI